MTDLQRLLQIRTSAFASVWSVWRPGTRRGVIVVKRSDRVDARITNHPMISIPILGLTYCLLPHLQLRRTRLLWVLLGLWAQGGGEVSRCQALRLRRTAVVMRVMRPIRPRTAPTATPPTVQRSVSAAVTSLTASFAV